MQRCTTLLQCMNWDFFFSLCTIKGTIWPLQCPVRRCMETDGDRRLRICSPVVRKHWLWRWWWRRNISRCSDMRAPLPLAESIFMFALPYYTLLYEFHFFPSLLLACAPRSSDALHSILHRFLSRLTSHLSTLICSLDSVISISLCPPPPQPLFPFHSEPKHPFCLFSPLSCLSSTPRLTSASPAHYRNSLSAAGYSPTFSVFLFTFVIIFSVLSDYLVATAVEPI